MTCGGCWMVTPSLHAGFTHYTLYIIHGLSHPRSKASGWGKVIVAGALEGSWGLGKFLRGMSMSRGATPHQGLFGSLRCDKQRSRPCGYGSGGPFPFSCGFTHLLIMVNRATRWPEANPLVSATAEEVVKAFDTCWIWGSDIASDMGGKSERVAIDRLKS